MMPKFKIGQVVVRNAPDTNYSYMNGLYTIEECISRAEYKRFYPYIEKPSSDFYYRLKGFSVITSAGNQIYHANESFLSYCVS